MNEPNHTTRDQQEPRAAVSYRLLRRLAGKVTVDCRLPRLVDRCCEHTAARHRLLKTLFDNPVVRADEPAVCLRADLFDRAVCRRDGATLRDWAVGLVVLWDADECCLPNSDEWLPSAVREGVSDEST